MEYLRNQENPMITSQREGIDTKRGSLDPVLIENLLKNNKSENNRNILKIINGSAEGVGIS